MRFLLEINSFSLSINISSCNINVISIGDQKCIAAFSNNLYVMVNISDFLIDVFMMYFDRVFGVQYWDNILHILNISTEGYDVFD